MGQVAVLGSVVMTTAVSWSLFVIDNDSLQAMST